MPRAGQYGGGVGPGREGRARPSGPLAPGCFSKLTHWPSSAPRGSNNARGTISVVLPAANGMKARIGLDGQGCASAAPEPRPIAAAMIAGYQQDFMSCVFRHATVQLEWGRRIWGKSVY